MLLTYIMEVTVSNFGWDTEYPDFFMISLVPTDSFFLNLHSGGWNQGPLDTAAT
jgi:hypothetical protein